MEQVAASPRVQRFLGRIGLNPGQRVERLGKPPAQSFDDVSSDHQEVARSFLVQQRINNPDYRAPVKQIRHHFRTKKQRESACNDDNWSFTTHEVARALHALLLCEPLPDPGVAWALLSHVAGISLSELWHHYVDPSLEKRTKKRAETRAETVHLPDIPWLDKVAYHNNIDYIRLLCQVAPGQYTLDHAFRICFSNRSIEGMRVMLSFGATTSACQEQITGHVGLQDLELATLLLSAPTSMTTEAWRYLVKEEITKSDRTLGVSLDILLAVFATRPEIRCGSLLLQAIRSQNLEAAAILLAYHESNEAIHDIESIDVCTLASHVQDHHRRYLFFTLLADAGLVVDCPALRAELLKDLDGGQISLAKILVKARVVLDKEPYNAVSWAVSQLDFYALELLQSGNCSEPIGLAGKAVPESTSELARIRLINIFNRMGADQASFSPHLVCAVIKKHRRLIPILLDYGASVEFDSAAAIHKAIEMANFEILSTLLQSSCQPAILATTLNTAMNLRSRASRLRAMTAILEKGIRAEDLSVHLRMAVSEGSRVDLELVQLLIRHNAPIDGPGDDEGNPVLVATRRCNIRVLGMLCEVPLQQPTLSKAVSIAVGLLSARDYETVLSMTRLLLEKGASGPAVHQALVDACQLDDADFEISRVLVEHGADANFLAGTSFSVAIRGRQLQLLKILCKSCQPDLSSLKSVFCTATDVKYYDLQILDLLLASAPSSATILNVKERISELLGHPSLGEMIPCFLRHGLNVNIGEGMLLCSAVRANDAHLLNTLLSTDPSATSLTAAFENAVLLEHRDVSLEMMRLLLEKAGQVEIGQSRALLHETEVAVSGDSTGLRMLLRHNARVDFGDGKSVQDAAVVGSVEVLELLLASGASNETVERAFLAVSSSTMTMETRKSIFARLLTSSDEISSDTLSKALSESIASNPNSPETPEFLIGHGAKADFETLRLAQSICSEDIFVMLAGNATDSSVATRIFKLLRGTEMTPSQRYSTYRGLLKSNVDTKEISEALIDCMKLDCESLDIPKLLLEHGAQVSHTNGVALGLALRSESIDAVRLLSQHVVDSGTANIVFSYVATRRGFKPDLRFEVYRNMMQWEISIPALSQALLDILSAEKTDGNSIADVRALLGKGADPNVKGAKCFIKAANAGLEPQFRALCQHAHLQMVIFALIAHFKEECEAATWIRICLEEQTGGKKIGEAGDLLFQCIRRFPRGTAALRLLLDHGVPASATIDHPLRHGWKPEQCTVLVWALFSKTYIGNSVIMLLLEQQASALPAYATPRSNVSAIFGCLFEKTRTPVLRALLELEDTTILNNTISGYTFSALARTTRKPEKELAALFEDDDRISPFEASLFLGNLSAFQLLKCGEDPDDGTLHLAALLALPDIVEFLLKRHDANHPAEEYDLMIPMALACCSKPFPWCKVASEEASWHVRVRATMRLLAPQTSPEWRHRGKSPFYIALENGIEATKAIVEALNIEENPSKSDKYLYIDRTGIKYAPMEYVEKFMELEDTEKEQLFGYLQDFDKKSPPRRSIEYSKVSSLGGSRTSSLDDLAGGWGWGT
ncbi:hypothetical protein GQ53DRAFT_851651 [Thozetella sp. PMI_491]|nr:hypothetical protein GQ53DRAFT_851651 [Thozetella sp. PMI_491]